MSRNRSQAPEQGRTASAGGGRLGTTSDNVWRRRRLSRRFAASRLAKWVFATSGEKSTFDNISFCGHPVGGMVTAKTDFKTVWFGNIARCKLGWVCATCNAQLRSARAAEIEALCHAHVEVEGSLSMMTVTVRHSRSMPLVDTLAAVQDSWRRLQCLDSWKSLRKFLVGQVVAPEVTLGQNGWHPHQHVLFFVRAGVSESVLNALLPAVRVDWLRLVNESLGVSPNAANGVDLVHFGADDAGAVGRYLSKFAKEMTASTMKKGVDPLSLLDRTGAGDLEAVAQFLEYASAMKGRRSIAFSKGLRELYGVGVKSDDQVLDGEELGVVIDELPLDVYMTFWESNTLDLILDHLEVHWCQGASP